MTRIIRTGIFTDSGGTQYQFWSGVLRSTAGVWAIFGDANHQSSNFWSISQDTEAIYLYGPSSHKMQSFIVSPDETYAQMGILAGASVVSGRATIKMARVNPAGYGVVPLNPCDTSLSVVFSDLWVEGWFLL